MMIRLLWSHQELITKDGENMEGLFQNIVLSVAVRFISIAAEFHSELTTEGLITLVYSYLYTYFQDTPVWQVLFASDFVSKTITDSYGMQQDLTSEELEDKRNLVCLKSHANCACMKIFDDRLNPEDIFAGYLCSSI